MGAASVGSVAAILFQVANDGGGGGVVGAAGGRVAKRGGDVESVGAGQGGYVVEPDATEAENGVTGGVGLWDSDAAVAERVLERVDAFLGVVGGHHGEVAGGGRRRCSGDFEGGAGVGGEEPGGEDGAAAAAVKGGAATAGGVDTAEELVGEVEAADLGLGLGRVCGDGVGVQSLWNSV